MRYLTKSRFAVALTCPAKLAFLDDSAFSNENNYNEFLQALAEGGHQVGALAKCLFPEGVEVEGLGHDEQVAQTEELLQRDEVTIFEAAIRVGTLFIRADVLRKIGSRLELYEVKAKGYDSRFGDAEFLTKKGHVSSEFKPYLYDVAFQRLVLSRRFPKSEIVSHLVMPDQAVVCAESKVAQRLPVRRVTERNVVVDIDASLRDGNVARSLLKIVQVDRFLDLLVREPVEAGGYTWSFEEGIAEIEDRFVERPFEPRLGSHCRSCEFRASKNALSSGLRDARLVCWSNATKVDSGLFSNGVVFDLFNFRNTDKLIADGKILLRDFDSHDVRLKEEPGRISLSNRQWFQCQESKNEIGPYVALKNEVRGKLEGLRFPLHFIDFETATPALPFHEGVSPYELVLFQFSHHRVDADGRIQHATQYISSTDGQFPNFDVVRALAAAIGGDEGSVIHWWTHERTVLTKVREQMAGRAIPDSSELTAFIDGLIGSSSAPGRLVDLGQHIVAPLVFFSGTKGSSSIKRVLPALLTMSRMLQEKYGAPIYGSEGPNGIRSLNFSEQRWVNFDSEGGVIDPYSLLSGRFGDAALDEIEEAEESRNIVADGGAAMVAYALLQRSNSEAQQKSLREQLFRYCELDTLAMVMAWEGLRDLVGQG